jgi:hypothetical protein
MTSVTFAQVGEHKTAKKMYTGDDVKNDFSDKGIGSLAERCRKAGVEVKVQSTAIASVPALKYYLSAENTIDMVLLGPNVTDNGNMCEKHLQKLVKTASNR